ncbi:hypothetical protein C8R47DRAFT_1243605 [Mycena vitilis]|nr:hypothetical protein C8R47DRAFT_1243605 [Mycena vitilis]
MPTGRQRHLRRRTIPRHLPCNALVRPGVTVRPSLSRHRHVVRLRLLVPATTGLSRHRPHPVCAGFPGPRIRAVTAHRPSIARRRQFLCDRFCVNAPASVCVYPIAVRAPTPNTRIWRSSRANPSSGGIPHASVSHSVSGRWVHVPHAFSRALPIARRSYSCATRFSGTASSRRRNPLHIILCARRPVHPTLDRQYRQLRQLPSAVGRIFKLGI